VKRYLCRHLNSNIKVEDINEVVFKEVFTLAKVWHKNASKIHSKMHAVLHRYLSMGALTEGLKAQYN
jgi:hypothetical protein